jgi:lysophospholipase L1-like esterase
MNLKQKLYEALVARKIWRAWRGAIEAAVVPGAGGIVMLGDSLTHLGRWELLFPQLRLCNFGIGGERSEHLLQRLQPVFALRPEKVFVLIGSNDLGTGRRHADIVRDVEALLAALKAGLPGCALHLQGVPPRQRKFARRIRALNAAYAEIARRQRIPFIDLYPLFDDGSGELRAALGYDRLHFSGAGYAVWREALAPYLRPPA